MKQFNIRTFTQLKDQASSILKVGYYTPMTLKIQHLSVKKDVVFHKKNQKDVNRLKNGHTTQVLTNIDIQEIVEMSGNICNIYEGFKYKKKTFKFTNQLKNV